MTLTMVLAKIIPSLLLFCILLVPGSTYDRNRALPEFDVTLKNQTAHKGVDVSFQCVVNHLGEYKVAWIRSEDKAVIAWHNHMVTHNHRFKVTHNGHNAWTLHISNVQPNDTGSYMCQVNTEPQRSQMGALEVVTPPEIIDKETSNDVVVFEGQSTTLKCKATGDPLPKVKWKRDDGRPLPLSRELLKSPSETVDVWEEERLPLRPLQRSDTGPYLCMANNTHPPVRSKTVWVFVHFQPSIKVESQLVAAPLGANVTLECIVEAVPRPVLSWFNKMGQLIINSVGKVRLESVILKDYSLRMRLSIAYLEPADFTEYNCTAGNSLGADYGMVKLGELPTPITSKPTTTTTHMEPWYKGPWKHGDGPRSSNGEKPKKNRHNKSSHQTHGHGGANGKHYESHDPNSAMDTSGDSEFDLVTPPSPFGTGTSRNGIWAGTNLNSKPKDDNPTNHKNTPRHGTDGSTVHPNSPHATSASRSSSVPREMTLVRYLTVIPLLLYLVNHSTVTALAVAIFAT